MRLSIILALILTVLSAQHREALLIGNNNYKNISTLDDPSYNLTRLKKTLEGLGFNVKIKRDLNSENLKGAIDNFALRLARYSDTIGFLYYTGHGCQVDYQGYLLPTNINTKLKRKIRYNALNINEMLEALEDAKNSVNMVFLDACRDVAMGAKGGSKGLGQPNNTPKGSLVVYATKAGEIAQDNSYFIDALITNIKIPNQNIRDIGDSLSLNVAKKSSYSQIPVVYSMLLPKVVLKRGGGVPPLPIQEPTIPKPISASKWITPTNSTCKANGGKIDKYGVCKANWKDAKKICSASGGRLPTIDELKEVVTDCGGIFNRDFFGKDADKNRNNNQYQKCYKKKGFPNSSHYWGSTTNALNNDNAWLVYFYDGSQNYYVKDDSYYVRCVRAGQ